MSLKRRIVLVPAILLIVCAVFLGVWTFRNKITWTPHGPRWGAKQHMVYPGRNVILISIDTLRPDHLGCYGYERNTSPNVDLFSKDAVLCTNTIAQAPSTMPSHASMLTSLIPPHHQAYHSVRSPIPPDVETLAEIMKGHGYQTVSYNGGGQVAGIFGFDQGFDTYESETSEVFNWSVQNAIEWIGKHPGERFFMFLHSYEVHHPYTPRSTELALFEKNYSGPLPPRISIKVLERINSHELKITDEDRQHIVNTYDAEIHSMDESFGRLIGFLRDNGLYDETLIVFTSDHGEELGEHGAMGWHGHTLYDELLKVPLLVKLPRMRFAASKIGQQARIIDIAPTVLGILGIKAPEQFEGEDLLQRIGATKAPILFAFSEIDCLLKPRPRSIRTLRWKLIGDALFDLDSDPGETRDVAQANMNVKRVLAAKMKEILESRGVTEASEQIELDEETREALKSLGYVR